MKKRVLLTISVLGLSLFLAGCGSTAPQKSATKPGAGQNSALLDKSHYMGAANLKKFESEAGASPKDANAQINAGMAAYSNKDYDKALAYYKQALTIHPKDGVAYNNIGNVYYRGLKKPKEALPYYEKAVQVQPTYAYGWLNLALCQRTLGDTTGAKATISKGLKAVNPADPIAKALQQLKGEIK